MNEITDDMIVMESILDGKLSHIEINDLLSIMTKIYNRQFVDFKSLISDNENFNKVIRYFEIMDQNIKNFDTIYSVLLLERD